MLKLVMPVIVKSDWNHPNILISQLNCQLQLDFQSWLITIENSIDHSKILMANYISNCQVSMLCQVGLAVIAWILSHLFITHNIDDKLHIYVGQPPHIKRFLSKVKHLQDSVLWA